MRRGHTITLQGRAVVRAIGAQGRPTVTWYDPGDELRVGWLDYANRWRERRLTPGEELVVEQGGGRGRERHYTLTILGPDDDVAGPEPTPVVYRSDTRPRPRRIRGSRWYRLRLTDTDYDRRHVAYLRSTDGVVIG